MSRLNSSMFLVDMMVNHTVFNSVKGTRSVLMNIFRKKKYFLFKSFVKIEFSYVITINMFCTAENCMEQ